MAAAAAGIGTSRRKTLLFKEQRARRQATASEEQKIVLRLETLLFRGPVAKGGKGKRERKDYEKSVVLWTHNSLSKLCTGCGSKFTTMRRRHHCRLCGDVLCSKCSLGLDVKSAYGNFDIIMTHPCRQLRHHLDHL